MAFAFGITCSLWHPPTPPPCFPSRNNSFLLFGDPALSSIRYFSDCPLQLSSCLTDRTVNGGDVGRTSRRRGGVVCEVVVEINGNPSTTEENPSQVPAVGSKIRVNGPLKVYHVPKIPEFDIGGQEGEIKDILKSWKGKPISANLPYKVQFQLEVEGRHVKLVAHLKEGEFEVVN